MIFIFILIFICSMFIIMVDVTSTPIDGYDNIYDKTKRIVDEIKEAELNDLKDRVKKLEDKYNSEK